jgi:hypothetical protein
MLLLQKLQKIFLCGWIHTVSLLTLQFTIRLCEPLLRRSSVPFLLVRLQHLALSFLMMPMTNRPQLLHSQWLLLQQQWLPRTTVKLSLESLGATQLLVFLSHFSLQEREQQQELQHRLSQAATLFSTVLAIDPVPQTAA